jgi:flagellar P-ring protein precursor FlgI
MLTGKKTMSVETNCTHTKNPTHARLSLRGLTGRLRDLCRGTRPVTFGWRTMLLVMLAVAALLAPARTSASTKLLNICRVKGQEENTVQGLGLVVGLSGTGDSSSHLPTIRALAAAMKLLGSPIGDQGVLELKNVKNVALVYVSATIPSAGARQGDQIDCTISSIGDCKSLAGGVLVPTMLVGPDRTNDQVYAMAEGLLALDDPLKTTVAHIHHGCRLEENFYNQFSKDGRITLVMNKNLGGFETAQNIAAAINQRMSKIERTGSIAKAIDAKNIEVEIPEKYSDDVVDFVSQVLSIDILEPTTQARVVINERNGSIVVGSDVQIGSVLITHRNIVVATGQELPEKQWIPIDPGEQPSVQLQALVESLNAVKVPTEDIIHIIKGLEEAGKLHGHLQVE